MDESLRRPTENRSDRIILLAFLTVLKQLFYSQDFKLENEILFSLQLDYGMIFHRVNLGGLYLVDLAS